MMLLSALLKDAGLENVIREDIEIESLTIDSREKVNNGLYFCLTGGVLDGHNFVDEAIQNGAVAIVTEKKLSVCVPQVLVENARIALSKLSSAYFQFPSRRLKVIGITGTNGKTTTAHMLASIFKQAGKKVGLIGTLGAEYDDKKFANSFTTPDPIFLHKTLRQMVLAGIEYVIIEVSAHALFYHKVDGVVFSSCIFTNLSQDHLDFFQDMQRYKEAKGLLFQDEVCPFAVLNGDDKVGWGYGKMRKNKTIYYGLDQPCDAFAIPTDEDLLSQRCIFNIQDKLCRVTLSFTGKHNIYNALSAGTCALGFGIDIKDVGKGLSNLKGVEGRLQRVRRYHGGEIFVDFAHTPDGIEKSLQALKKHTKGRLLCLFGCGGNRDKTKRPIMGEKVAKLCDFSVLTADNPRYEDPLDILQDIEKGYRRFSNRYVIVPDRKKAIEYAIDCLKKGDVLLIAGKGGERYQEIMGIKYDFVDNDIIEKICQEKEEKLPQRKTF